MHSFSQSSIHNAIVSKFAFSMDNNGTIKANYLEILDNNDLKIH